MKNGYEYIIENSFQAGLSVFNRICFPEWKDLKSYSSSHFINDDTSWKKETIEQVEYKNNKCTANCSMHFIWTSCSYGKLDASDAAALGPIV